MRKESSRLRPQEGPWEARATGARRLRNLGRLAGRPGAVGRSWCGNQAGKGGWHLIRSEQDRVWIWGFYSQRAVTPWQSPGQRDDALVAGWEGRLRRKQAS